VSIWLYGGLFVAVVALDQLSKRWAVRTLPIADGPVPWTGLAWTRTTSPALERLGHRGAISLWLLVGAAGGALCLASGGGGVGALGGVAAWAAGASNIGDWWRRGAVVDWVRLWPRSLANIADAVLILGSAQLVVWIAAS
jgi:lipoprotein signal peptidase